MPIANPSWCPVGQKYLYAPNFVAGDYANVNGTITNPKIERNSDAGDMLCNLATDYTLENSRFVVDMEVKHNETTSSGCLFGIQLGDSGGRVLRVGLQATLGPLGRIVVQNYSGSAVNTSVSDWWADIAYGVDLTCTFDIIVGAYKDSVTGAFDYNRYDGVEVNAWVTGSGVERTINWESDAVGVGNNGGGDTATFYIRASDVSGVNYARATSVYLIADDASFDCTGGLPTAAFSADTTSGYANLEVNFTDESTESPTSWLWDFGDGNTSTEQNPTHTYEEAGDYTVTLTATNAAGSDDEVKTDYITVDPPVAGFSGTPLSGKTIHTVTFTDASLGNIVSRLWDFGDGFTSTSENPVHAYGTSGTYTVILTVTDEGGNVDSETKVNYVAAIAPEADFIGTPLSGDPPLDVGYTDLST